MQRCRSSHARYSLGLRPPCRHRPQVSPTEVGEAPGHLPAPEERAPVAASPKGDRHGADSCSVPGAVRPAVPMIDRLGLVRFGSDRATHPKANHLAHARLEASMCPTPKWRSSRVHPRHTEVRCRCPLPCDPEAAAVLRRVAEPAKARSFFLPSPPKRLEQSSPPEPKLPQEDPKELKPNPIRGVGHVKEHVREVLSR